MKNFKELLVWKKSHILTFAIYGTIKLFPKEELYGLTSQIRRSTISIPSNIAEGCDRLSDKELAQFLIIANGSASELSYQILLAKDLNYLSVTDYDQLDIQLTEVQKMLSAFIRKLRSV
ncbi:MAG TPA: four helix bundle protein [Dyadobacter sp.]|jgi:four helix bundle protein|nr:four helix bundle protein [Dyadobacter sp.]